MKCGLVLSVFEHFVCARVPGTAVYAELPSSRKGLKPAICPSMNYNNNNKPKQNIDVNILFL